MVRYFIFTVILKVMCFSNALASDCDSFIFYLCSAEEDILRILDKESCEHLFSKNIQNNYHLRREYKSIQIKYNSKYLNRKTQCKLRKRSYVIEVKPCMERENNIIPTVTIYSDNMDIFCGAYGGECRNCRDLVYFHYATSDKVELGKRTLDWGSR